MEACKLLFLLPGSKSLINQEPKLWGTFTARGSSSKTFTIASNTSFSQLIINNKKRRKRRRESQFEDHENSEKSQKSMYRKSVVHPEKLKQKTPIKHATKLNVYMTSPSPLDVTGSFELTSFIFHLILISLPICLVLILQTDPNGFADGFMLDQQHHKSSHWSYNDQNVWRHNHKYCGLRAQSPIDIQTRNVQENLDLKLHFYNYDRAIKFKLQNEHHTIKMRPEIEIDNLASSSHNNDAIGKAIDHSEHNNGISKHTDTLLSSNSDQINSSSSSSSSNNNNNNNGGGGLNVIESAEELEYMNRSLPNLMLPVQNNNNNDQASKQQLRISSKDNKDNIVADSTGDIDDDPTPNKLERPAGNPIMTTRLPYDGIPTVKLDTLDEGYNVFNLHDIHLHWAERKDNGSEHAIDGRKGAMELHLVHLRHGVNKTNLESSSDGLLVIGIIIDSLRKSNAQFDPIVNSLTRINGSSEPEFIEYRSLNELLPDQLDKFYWYWGSLTTPPCFETVHWIVMERRLYMNSKQIEMFRQLYAPIGTTNDEDFEAPRLIMPNVRNLQSNQNRPIFGTKGLGRGSTAFTSQTPSGGGAPKPGITVSISSGDSSSGNNNNNNPHHGRPLGAKNNNNINSNNNNNINNNIDHIHGINNSNDIINRTGFMGGITSGREGSGASLGPGLNAVLAIVAAYICCISLNILQL